MLEIKEKSTYLKYEYTGTQYVIDGDCRKSDTGEIKEIMMNVKDSDGGQKGYVNAYPDGGELKYNLNGVAIEDMAAVSAAVAECAQALMEEGTEDVLHAESDTVQNFV